MNSYGFEFHVLPRDSACEISLQRLQAEAMEINHAEKFEQPNQPFGL
jgi:hypothetical protein